MSKGTYNLIEAMPGGALAHMAALALWTGAGNISRTVHAVAGGHGKTSHGTLNPATLAAAAPVHALSYAKAIAAQAAAQGIPPQLLGALVQQESGGHQSAVSPAGAIGLTQLEPGTASMLGVDPYSVSGNLSGGSAYFAQQYKRFRSVRLALAAYNMGPAYGKPGAHGVKYYVDKYGPTYADVAQHLPGQTQAYVSDITGNLGTPQMHAIAQAMAEALAQGVLKVQVVSATPHPNRGQG